MATASCSSGTSIGSTWWPSDSSSRAASAAAVRHSSCTGTSAIIGASKYATRSPDGSRSHQDRLVSPAGSGAAQNGSPTAGPASTSSSAAVSRTVRPIGPDVARPTGSPYIGAELTRPRLGFRPTRPQQPAGIRIEPPPSEPCASGTSPAATAAPAPPLEPPAVRVRSQGVRAGGATSGSV